METKDAAGSDDEEDRYTLADEVFKTIEGISKIDPIASKFCGDFNSNRDILSNNSYQKFNIFELAENFWEELSLAFEIPKSLETTDPKPETLNITELATSQ